MGNVPLALREMSLHPKGETYWDAWLDLSTATQESVVPAAVIRENPRRM